MKKHMKVKNRSIPLPSQNRTSSHSLVEWPLLDVGFMHHGREREGFEAWPVTAEISPVATIIT